MCKLVYISQTYIEFVLSFWITFNNIYIKKIQKKPTF
jgi:hypothetical protein